MLKYKELIYEKLIIISLQNESNIYFNTINIMLYY